MKLNIMHPDNVEYGRKNYPRMDEITFVLADCYLQSNDRRDINLIIMLYSSFSGKLVR
jgi:hypothetical protein